ncbi:hypothetical protein Tco_0654890 [Tanacetum coccineum]|uniref:Uncharacterized protein n=1 Tax=Tanacetum coccineum TaxID=301880 RepID=A0ABQ4X5K8_9ASTR
MQTTKGKVDTYKALDASLVDIESSRAESKEPNTSNGLGNDAHADDADIRPIYHEKPMAEVQTNTEINVFATGQQNTKQPELNNEGVVDQNAEQCHDTCPLPAKLTNNQKTKLSYQSLESENIWKPVLQPHRTQSVVRQPTAFKSERPRISKPPFASQVDVNNDLSKPVTIHYLPKERESAVVKPHHVIAFSKSRNSSNMPRFSSNDMVHNHYLEEAKKKTQESGRNSKPSVMPSARSQSTANDCKPKHRINNQNSRNWPASKSSCITTKTMPIAEHSRNSSNFSDTKHFVCSTCRKCVFNANHDHYVTKFLNKVNSRAKVPSNKTTKRYKPVEQISVAKKPERQISKGHRFSIKKTFVVHKKTMTPRSCLKWKPTGKLFKTIGLRWVHIGKIFTSSTTKVGSEPPNGSNEDITNPYKCELLMSVHGFKEFKSDKQAMTFDHNSSELRIHDHSNKLSSSKLVPKVVPPADKTATS